MNKPALGKETSLVESLKSDAGWEIYNFGYDGANPPYVRINVKFRFFPLRVEPLFESFRPDKFWFRSKVSLEKHLRAYDWIKINSIVFEEAYGRKFATEATFPFNQWLRMGRIEFPDLRVWSTSTRSFSALPLDALSIAAGVWLRRDS